MRRRWSVLCFRVLPWRARAKPRPGRNPLTIPLDFLSSLTSGFIITPRLPAAFTDGRCDAGDRVVVDRACGPSRPARRGGRCARDRDSRSGRSSRDHQWWRRLLLRGGGRLGLGAAWHASDRGGVPAAAADTELRASLFPSVGAPPRLWPARGRAAGGSRAAEARGKLPPPVGIAIGSSAGGRRR